MRFRNLVTTVLFGLALLSSLAIGLRPAEAKVRIQVDLSTQTMHVESASGADYSWPVSTARRGFVTPRGTYGVQSMQRMHLSHKYHNSPMPYSIFFRGGYAIHGTYAVNNLGRAASHGCVRISPANAALLYDLVKAEGAQISITGSAPADVRYAGAERHRGHHRYAGVAARRSNFQPTAYAPVVRAPAPSYDDWMQNLLGSGY